jgi:hypothetical protein
MAMQRQLFCINSLAVEFGLDRRTVAKRIDGIPPANQDGVSKQWYLESVIGALTRNQQTPAERHAGGVPRDELISGRLQNWRDVHKKPKREISIDEFAELFDCDTETILQRLRAGMPYTVEGNWDTGEGFLLIASHAMDWCMMVLVLLRLTGETTLADDLGMSI